MKLIELQGYKEHPAYQAVKRLTPAPDQPGPKRNSFNQTGMQSIVDELGKLGWNVAGKGYFATVFENPAKDYVLKIFFKDSGYRLYASIIAANQQNPHVPKLRGKLQKIADDVYAIRMERLQPLSSWNDPVLQKYTGRIYQNPNPEIFDNNPISAEDIFDEENMEFLSHNHPKLFDLVNIIDSKFKGEMDICEDNVMKRGGTLVVTDPLSSSS